jgi:hypothetical protein
MGKSADGRTSSPVSARTVLSYCVCVRRSRRVVAGGLPAVQGVTIPVVPPVPVPVVLPPPVLPP